MARTYSLSQLVMQSYSMRSIRDGKLIPDEVARLIAGVHVVSAEPALTALEQTGAIELDAVLSELRVRFEHLRAPFGQEIDLSAAFFALQCYVIHHGPRDVVPEWATEQDAYLIASRYSERSDPNGGHGEFPWASDELLTELVARQRADYTPLFTACLRPDEVETLHSAVIAYDTHLGGIPNPPGIIAAFGVGILLAEGEDGDDTYTWDARAFASMLHGLRWYALHRHKGCRPSCGDDDVQRKRTRTLYVEIAEALGVTVTD
jgi:hypothetical protein